MQTRAVRRVVELTGRHQTLLLEAVNELEELGGSAKYFLGENFGQIEAVLTNSLRLVVVDAVGVLAGSDCLSRVVAGVQKLVERELALVERFRFVGSVVWTCGTLGVAAVEHQIGARVLQLVQNGHRFRVVFQKFQVHREADLHDVGQ